jgi:hypothetical protein
MGRVGLEKDSSKGPMTGRLLLLMVLRLRSRYRLYAGDETLMLGIAYIVNRDSS